MTFNRIVFQLFCLFAASWLGGCDSPPREGGASEARALPVEVVALEDALFACGSEREVAAFLEKYPYLADVYFPDATGRPPEPLAGLLFERIRNKALREFKEEIDSLYKDKSQWLGEPLGRAFGTIKEYYPDFSPPRVATIVTGFAGSDLYVSDTLIIVGLEYFGGPAATYRPQVYDYQLRRYQPAYLAPSILFFLSDRFIRMDPQDKTLLADMVGYGKAFEFVKHSLPQTPDSLILGFSGRDLTRAYNSQTQLWAYVVENRLLYEKAELAKQKYVGERPFTPEIGPEVPGGIGRWLGWRIVSKYLETNPSVTLPELLGNPDARQILQESGYKGQVDE